MMYFPLSIIVIKMVKEIQFYQSPNIVDFAFFNKDVNISFIPDHYFQIPTSIIGDGSKDSLLKKPCFKLNDILFITKDSNEFDAGSVIFRNNDYQVLKIKNYYNSNQNRIILFGFTCYIPCKANRFTVYVLYNEYKKKSCILYWNNYSKDMDTHIDIVHVDNSQKSGERIFRNQLAITPTTQIIYSSLPNSIIYSLFPNFRGNILKSYPKSISIDFDAISGVIARSYTFIPSKFQPVKFEW